jgi:NAD(P)-dependent dehydrogenase (short-subunit alcohol dehydrogenase family)
MRLTGKNIVVTGASRGLGRQLALAFAREDARGLALVARNADRLYQLREEIRAIAPRAKVLVLAADLAKAEDIERVAAATLSEFAGRVDVIVNNASVLGPSPMPYLLDYPPEEFRRVLEVNLVAPFLLTRKILPAMLEQGGSVINVTSEAGANGYPGWGAYGISKFGLEGLTETWAAELEDTGIRVNQVDPGNLDTDMHRAAEPGEDPSQWADPAEVTGIFVHLASDAARNVNGRRFQAQEDWARELAPSVPGRGA